MPSLSSSFLPKADEKVTDSEENQTQELNNLPDKLKFIKKKVSKQVKDYLNLTNCIIYKHFS